MPAAPRLSEKQESLGDHKLFEKKIVFQRIFFNDEMMIEFPKFSQVGHEIEIELECLSIQSNARD